MLLSTPEVLRSSGNFILNPRWSSSRNKCTCYTANLALVRPNGPIPIILNCKACVLHQRTVGSTGGISSGTRDYKWLLSTTTGEMKDTDVPRYCGCATDTHAACLSRGALDGGIQMSSSSPPITIPVIGSPTILQPWQLFRGDALVGSSLSGSQISTSDMEFIQLCDSLFYDL